MMDYFVDTCNYNEDDAKDVVNELLIERYYEETGDDFDVQAGEIGAFPPSLGRRNPPIQS